MFCWSVLVQVVRRTRSTLWLLSLLMSSLVGLVEFCIIYLHFVAFIWISCFIIAFQFRISNHIFPLNLSVETLRKPLWEEEKKNTLTQLLKFFSLCNQHTYTVKVKTMKVAFITCCIEYANKPKTTIFRQT